MNKRLPLILLIMVSCLTAKSQLPSDCAVPEILKGHYETDVKDLALKWLYSTKSPDTASIDIPQWSQDTVWSGLAAIFNRIDQTEIDSVFNKHCIHTSPSNSIIYLQLMVMVDTTFGWTINWMNMQTTTGIASLDSLLSQYGFKITGFYHWMDHTFHVAILTTDQLLNVTPLCSALKSYDGISEASPDYMMGDGNYIQFDQEENVKYFTFSLAWGDCPSGCTSHHNWKFKVFPDCSVEFTGIENNIIDNYYPEPVNCNIAKSSEIPDLIQPVIGDPYPNPAGEMVIIPFSNRNKDQKVLMVFDITGRLIRTISLPDLSEGNIFWDLKATNGNKVNAGMYYLSIAGSSNNTLKKIILLP